MLNPHRHTRLDIERQLVRDAAQRLTSGNPERSNGTLTISALAAEAGVSRQRLYEHHPDLVADFKVASGGHPSTPESAALQRQLAAGQARIQELETREANLLAQIKTLRALLTELTHEAHADNIVVLPKIGRPAQASAQENE